MVRRVPSKQRNALVRREHEHGGVQRLVLLLISGLLLAGGFVYAGGQHFGALNFGYKTENLRRRKEELAEKQRRLLSEREAAASPGRLERAARQLGLQPLQAAQISPLKSFAGNSTTKPSVAEKEASAPKPIAPKPSPRPTEKTAASSRSKDPLNRTRDNLTR